MTPSPLYEHLPGSIVEYSRVEAGDVRGWLDVRPLVLSSLYLRLQPRVRYISVKHVFNGVVCVFVGHVPIRSCKGRTQIIQN